jgi:hypothetical protein
MPLSKKFIQVFFNYWFSVNSFKKQIEDAEEIAALNLAKFRKAQQQLEEAEERTKLAESHMTRLGAGERGGLSLLVRERDNIWTEKQIRKMSL